MFEEIDREGLLKVMAHDRQVKNNLAERLVGTVLENAELYALIEELEADLATERHQHHEHHDPPDA